MNIEYNEDHTDAMVEMDFTVDKTRLVDYVDYNNMDIVTIEVSGFGGAFSGMRAPMNSWNKQDSYYDYDGNYIIGPNDMKLAKTLISGGGPHQKFLRMIHVQAAINMTRYWWSEADTYHFNVKNSQSTMHKLLNNNNPITKEMFITCEEDDDVVIPVIERLESLRIAYKDIQKNCTDATKDQKLIHLLVRAKRMLPEGFLQMRVFDSDYDEIRRMYHWRKSHRLQEEWGDTFCAWAETLPYAQDFIIN